MESMASERRRPAFQVIGFLTVAALSVLLWWGWLGWDTQYQVDAATNEASGPYQAWQVIGCALSLLILLVSAVLAGLRPLFASAALTLAFTTAWTAQAATTDDTGLYIVGALLLFVGLAAASLLVSFVTARVRRR